MNSLSKIIIESLENLSQITLIPVSDSVYEAIEEKKSKAICSIDALKKNYTISSKTGFEDVYRILEHYNFKDVNSTEVNKAKCDGLSCEDCSGCAYNTLTSLYNSRKILEKHLDKNILENYTFIGGLSIVDKLIAKSPYRKYISYIDGKFSINSPTSILPSRKDFFDPPVNNLLDNLFIDLYIPEVLKISKDIKKIYGIYKNKAVLWELKVVNNRNIWTYTLLNA